MVNACSRMWCYSSRKNYNRTHLIRHQIGKIFHIIFFLIFSQIYIYITGQNQVVFTSSYSIICSRSFMKCSTSPFGCRYSAHVVYFDPQWVKSITSDSISHQVRYVHVFLNWELVRNTSFKESLTYIPTPRKHSYLVKCIENYSHQKD